jgi:hypothetical protein
LTLEEGVNTVPLLPSSSLHQHPDQELGWATEVSLNTVKSFLQWQGIEPCSPAHNLVPLLSELSWLAFEVKRIHINHVLNWIKEPVSHLYSANFVVFCSKNGMKVHVLHTRWCTCSEDVSQKTCHHISTRWHNLHTTVCWRPGGTIPLFCWDVVGVERQSTSDMCFTIWCSLLALSTRYPHIFHIITCAEGVCVCCGHVYSSNSDFQRSLYSSDMRFLIDGVLDCSLPIDHTKQPGSWVQTCCMNLLSLSLIDPPIKMEAPDSHETLLTTYATVWYNPDHNQNECDLVLLSVMMMIIPLTYPLLNH